MYEANEALIEPSLLELLLTFEEVRVRQIVVCLYVLVDFVDEGDPDMILRRPVSDIRKRDVQETRF